MHSTANLNDGYLGTGKRIRASIKRYGRKAHIREILEELPTRQALAKREAEVVNRELLKDPLCLNLKLGGEGGLAGLEPWNKGKKCKIISENVKKQSQTGNFHCIGDHWRGKFFSEEHKAKLSQRAIDRQKHICEFCGKENLSPAMFARWHGVKCKSKT